MGLRTVESAYSREIELNNCEVVLYAQAPDVPTIPLPSSMLFAIPLMEDTPQSIHTPISFVSHTLTATLHPTDSQATPLVKSLVVHTRRYASHEHTLAVSPEQRSISEPTRVEVELPRTTFRSGEPIPVYIRIPPPARELVMDRGLRLRNVKAELIRVIRVRQYDDGDRNAAVASPEGSSSALNPPEKSRLSMSLKTPISPNFEGEAFTSVLARSGASCRFHSSRTVQQRLMLHQTSPLSTPSLPSINLPAPNLEGLDSISETSSISQVTVLHSVTFHMNVHIAFVDVSARSEQVYKVDIPITLLPPPAPLPEVEAGIDEGYQKKHDPPPTITNRYDDMDSAPHYSYAVGEPGPSHPHGAPPPFEEPDAPPPFFSTQAEASSSSRLPTFLESETEIIIPDNIEEPSDHYPLIIEGEGVLFGFLASQQFDGHSEDVHRATTPPPTLEEASRDPDVTQLADVAEPERTLEAIGLVLSQAESEHELPPPPPPAMDDPSDPPPSIDSDFRSADSSRQSPPPPDSISSPNHLPPTTTTSDRYAPPPYLVNNTEDQENVTRPPPYVD